ncbi:MAG: hypothetical protein AB1597_02955 [Chloroflexota bacterium]
MDAALRILHIIFGVYVGGMYIFATLILLPKLHSLGSKVERSVIRSVLSVASPVNAVSLIIVIGTGVAMTFRLQGGDISKLLTTGWGVTIFIGAIAAVVATLIGFVLLMPKGLRMDKIYRSIGEGEPNAEQANELDDMIARFRKIERVNFVLMMIALISMPVSRFVRFV